MYDLRTIDVSSPVCCVTWHDKPTKYDICMLSSWLSRQLFVALSCSTSFQELPLESLQALWSRCESPQTLGSRNTSFRGRIWECLIRSKTLTSPYSGRCETSPSLKYIHSYLYIYTYILWCIVYNYINYDVPGAWKTQTIVGPVKKTFFSRKTGFL